MHHRTECKRTDRALIRELLANAPVLQHEHKLDERQHRGCGDIGNGS